LSLLVGGTLLGLWGMLLAVPTAMVIKVVALHVWDTRSQWPPREAQAGVTDVAAVRAEPVPNESDGAVPVEVGEVGEASSG
jgi:hypothetical protein